MAIFFVNQSKAYEGECAGSYLWSPKLNRVGHRNNGYELMKEVKKGDFILHNGGNKVVAISKVEEDCRSADNPKALKDETNAWGNDGWRVSIKYYDFTSPLPISAITERAREHPQDYGAFTKGKGIPKQQYLCRITNYQARYILEALLRGEKDENVKEVINSALGGLPSESCI